MAWKKCDIMDERIKFISRLLDGEGMTELCREFNISRKTGYKFYNRYKEEGLEGFVNKSRKPIRLANMVDNYIEELVVSIREERPTWGARKIREVLIRKHKDVKLPALSTIHVILDRNGLVKSRKRRRFKAEGTVLSAAANPNDLWSADFKGQFRLKNSKYCYPLTITDNVSRYILACESLESNAESTAFPVFERTFYEHGLPRAIRTDNGVPFASPNSLFQLSKLSVWWLRLGIKFERIEPGHPQQNGRHERMHRTLKDETTKPPASNILQQQEMFDLFIHHFNSERPHQSLEMKCPAEVHYSSKSTFDGKLPDIDYSNHQHRANVSVSGSIKFQGSTIFISESLASQPLGISSVEEDIWAVDFMNYRIGFFDSNSTKLKLSTNPFL